MREEIFNMTQKEITRLRVINQTIDGVLTIREAADLLGLSERVEKEKIDKILTGALTAPSGRNIKPWELIVVDDKEIIQKLAASRGPASRPLANAPLAIVVAANPELTDIWIEDASIITIIIQLMAQSLGLGSCWIQVRERLTQDNERVSDYVKKILSIPENYEVEAMVP